MRISDREASWNASAPVVGTDELADSSEHALARKTVLPLHLFNRDKSKFRAARAFYLCTLPEGAYSPSNPSASEMLGNPFGPYVHAFYWASNRVAGGALGQRLGFMRPSI
jgi:hypothetical protein